MKTMVSNRKPPDTSTWLTRNESSDLLTVSTQTLANYQRRGLLHPQYVVRADVHGQRHRVTVYDPKELAKLPRFGRLSPHEPGEVTARACELFREGKTNEEVIIELRETFDRIQELREKWMDASSAALVISPGAKESFEKIVGPFKSVADLLEIVTKKLAT
jgi:DNA-binding transcriptional MerR regulator